MHVSGLLATAVLALAPPATALADDAPPADASGSEVVIRGQASYRERIALLPGAVFEATLEDVSRADAKATVLGSARIESPGSIPIRFEIPYDPKQIDESHRYSVRARITAHERLAFTTDTAAPVLTQGHGREVDLLLVRVPSRPPQDAPPGAAR